MGTNTTNNRWRLSVAAGFTLIALLGACAGSEPEAMIGGLDVSAAIQQGGSFEMTLPIRENTFVGVVDEPAGVTTLVSHANNGKAVKVSLDVAADALRWFVQPHSAGRGRRRTGRLRMGFLNR